MPISPVRTPAGRRGRLAAPALGLLLLVAPVSGCTSDPPPAAGSAGTVSDGSAAGGSPSGGSGSASAGPSRSDTAAQRLAADIVSAAVDRLSIMPAVAQVKWVEDLPVRDRAREREVVARFVKAAAADGVPRDVATAVITDQIDAAGNVQQSLIDAWDSGGYPEPDGPVPDLTADLRPRIDDATDELAAALARLMSSGVPADWPAVLAQEQGQVLESLPDGVTAVDLSLALGSVGDLAPTVS